MLDKVPGLAERAEEWIKDNSAEIRESVAVYLFLRKNFEQGRVSKNPMFQFVYRSFYRMDNAGLLPQFHSAYFDAMDKSRGKRTLDLKQLVLDLYKDEFNRKKQRRSLQFSFITKLAHTVNPDEYPIYDSEIARAFEFSPPFNKDYHKRLDRSLEFYEDLRTLYREVIDRDILNEHLRVFRERYVPADVEIPQAKVIDFTFWSAGKKIKQNKLMN